MNFEMKLSLSELLVLSGKFGADMELGEGEIDLLKDFIEWVSLNHESSRREAKRA